MLLMAPGAEPMAIVARSFAYVALSAGVIGGAVTLKRSVSYALVSAFTMGLTAFHALCIGCLFFLWLDGVFPRGVSFLVPEKAPYILGNFHAHSRLSAGFFESEDLVVWHYRRGYRVLAVTDSNRIDGSLRALDWCRNKKFPMVIVTGEEFRGPNHLILLGIKKSLKPSEWTIPQAIEETKKQGGIAIAAHPWNGRFPLQRLADWGISAAEYFPGVVRDGKSLQQVMRDLRLPAVGSLDLRYSLPAAIATVLPASATTPETVIKAIKEGRCAALMVLDSVVPLHLTPNQKLVRSFGILVRQSGPVGLLGVLFWTLLGLVALLKRRNPSITRYKGHRPTGSLFRPVMIVLSSVLLSSLVAFWTLSRDLADFPRLPVGFAILIGLIACSASLKACYSLYR